MRVLTITGRPLQSSLINTKPFQIYTLLQESRKPRAEHSLLWTLIICGYLQYLSISS